LSLYSFLTLWATTGPVFPLVNTNACDKDIFILISKPALSTLSFYLESQEDRSSVHQAFLGLKYIADIAAMYRQTEIFDSAVFSFLFSDSPCFPLTLFY